MSKIGYQWAHRIDGGRVHLMRRNYKPGSIPPDAPWRDVAVFYEPAVAELVARILNEFCSKEMAA